jgi:hypothetical protein
MRAAALAAFARVAFLSAGLFAGCAQTPTPLEPIDAPKLGTLESAYDRGKWRWVRNPDGRALLRHTELAKCFVDPEPPHDFRDAGFTVKRSAKTIGSSRYEVVSVYDKNDFWEALYVRPGSARPVLSVYAEGRCQEEAERILLAYERSLTK